MSLRVTFITPHQDPLSGGAQEIQMFAQHLAAHACVTLLTLSRKVTPVENVDVRHARFLTADEVPDADVLVCFAGLPHGERLGMLPMTKGVPVLYFAGHHPHVTDNLRRIPRVLALSGWLVGEARRLGCTTYHVTRPLDRELWRPGPPQSERPPIITLMLHRSPGKGVHVGVEAIRTALAEHPSAEVHLFGQWDGTPPDGLPFPVVAHGPLVPADVAELLRRTSVFVWPSHIEGFGLPGLEAIASGAALASTDSRGNRGYALHEQTALVSPAGDATALAANITRFLQDVNLRTRLADAGAEHIAYSYPSWPAAAATLATTLATIARERMVIKAPAVGQTAVGTTVSPRHYLGLLKSTLTGAVHQEVFSVVRRPEDLLDVEARSRLTADGVVLAHRPDANGRVELVEEGKQWPLVAETMIGLKRLNQIERALERVYEREIPGDFIEAGVWRGGASIFMRGFLEAYGIRDRRVCVADSFVGLPRPDEARYPADAGDKHYTVDLLAVSLDEVRRNFRRYGLLDEQVEFHPGWFKDTLPRLRDRTWAVIRLDGDMYESTMDSLINLYPSLSLGGFVIIDDYGAIPAAKKAVDDYRAEWGIETPLQPIDWTGVYWRKEHALPQR